jgi:phosphotransferase system enzyme I (PtsI)
VLDVDLDKPLPFLSTSGDGAYAARGLGVLLANEEVLRTQLEALAKAHEHYPSVDLWVMAPMVTAAAEAARFAELARAAGLPCVGAMIEVPEVTEPEVLSEVLASVDFLSIGTNDLTQYTLGKSRHSEAVTLEDTRNEVLLEIIERVISAAKNAGKPVGICGEAAADIESARLFIDFGVDSLSGSAALLPALRLALS